MRLGRPATRVDSHIVRLGKRSPQELRHRLLFRAGTAQFLPAVAEQAYDGSGVPRRDHEFIDVP